LQGFGLAQFVLARVDCIRL